MGGVNNPNKYSGVQKSKTSRKNASIFWLKTIFLIMDYSIRSECASMEGLNPLFLGQKHTELEIEQDIEAIHISRILKLSVSCQFSLQTKKSHIFSVVSYFWTVCLDQLQTLKSWIQAQFKRVSCLNSPKLISCSARSTPNSAGLQLIRTDIMESWFKSIKVPTLTG